MRIPVGGGFAGRIAAERRPVILDRVEHGTVLNPLLLRKGIRSLGGVPLLAQGAVLGVLHAGTLRDRVFTADDAALLQLAADRAAMAVQSLRTREDRAAALALQAAAVVMGRIRSVLRAYALEFPGPEQVLAKLDHKMQYFEQTPVMATVAYAVLDPQSGQLAVSSAGHLPPVIAVPGQRPALAAIAAGPPIGVADPASRQVTTLALAPGTAVCLFTDGLVERRAEPVTDGIGRLCQALTPGPPEDMCGCSDSWSGRAKADHAAAGTAGNARAAARTASAR